MWAYFVACAIFIQCASCLRLVRLDVPHAILNGDSIWLNCSFDLEADELYSVKWYKNNVEFYRYLPSDNPPAQKYDLLGVYLDLEKSLKGHIYLYKTDLNSEGTYRCEVSAEAPSFQTVREEKDMRIYVLPTDQPTIIGIRSHYGIGEEINVTCLAGPSKPPSKIQWYINGREAPFELLKTYSSKRYKTGLLSSRVGLKFVIESIHYWDGIMRIGCIAIFSQLYYVGSEEVTLSNKSSGLRYKSAPGYGRKGPTINGVKGRYHIGDVIELNCTSIMHPKPQLQWIVNNEVASPEHVIVYKVEESNKSLLGLRFQIFHHHFIEDQLNINCTAKLSVVNTFKTEQTILGSSQYTSGLQMSENRGVYNNGTRSQHILTLILILLRLLRL